MGKKVLVIEDDAMHARLLSDLLNKSGYSVLVSCDGEGVDKKALEYVPDMVIMDLRLHNKSGVELIRVIKSDPMLKNIPVVALTAVVDKEIEREALEAGCCAYITKPFSVESILEIVNIYINKAK